MPNNTQFAALDNGLPTETAHRVQDEDFRMSSVRVNWQIKAILPIGFVLVAGLMLFTLATVSLRDPERHAVMIVAGAGAVAICAVAMLALAYLIQRPIDRKSVV